MGALSDLPPELVVGWALWVIGGLLLMMWFVRRSAATRTREVAPPLPAAAAAPRLPGTDAVAAQPLSGRAAAGQSLAGIRPCRGEIARRREPSRRVRRAARAARPPRRTAAHLMIFGGG